MSRPIYTYADLRKLPQNPAFATLKKYPMITVSADMKKQLTESRQFRGMVPHVTIFRSILHAIDEGWGTDQRKFAQLTILSAFLRRKLAENQNNQQTANWLLGCQRNIKLLHSAIMLLEQAQLKPDDLVTNGERNLELLVEAWEDLSMRDGSIRRSHERFAPLTTRAMWEPVLNRAFHMESAHAVSTIVLHGFYYFTPIQEHLMRLLEQAGFQLIFLIPYDERYPFVYELWDRTYGEGYGYPPKAQWHISKSDADDPYGEIFEGRPAEIRNDLQVKEYASTIEFVNAVQKIREDGYTLYSADPNGANELLKDFYPESYGERRALSYPIGQFIGNLNRLWDETKQAVILDKEHLIECFASGWLAKDGVSGREYLKDLVDILPFFERCRTVPEWEQRIARLEEIQGDIADAFAQETDPDERIARWQRTLGDPLGDFGPFAVPAERLKIILALIRQLLEMAQRLFPKNQPLSVQEYISKLDAVLKSSEMSDELYEEERELVRDIFERFGSGEGFETQCHPADVSGALNLYFTGHFDDGEIQPDRPVLVNPLYLADSASIKEKGKVHICLCDVSRLPGKDKQYIWPLHGKAVQRIREKANHLLLENLVLVMESRALLSRYFLYSALKNPSVQLSWVSRMDDKPLGASSYLQLLCNITGTPIIPPARRAITYNTAAKAKTGEEKFAPYEKEKMPMYTIKEARMDYAVCPMRYLLGYVLEEHPKYRTRFQQTYTLGAFIAALHDAAELDGRTVDEVYQQVIGLFPNLRRVEKRQIYDWLRHNGFSEEEQELRDGVTTCGKYDYTDRRLLIHYPDEGERSTARSLFGKLYTPDGRNGISGDPDRKHLISCNLCPHIDDCKNAEYPADQESVYEQHEAEPILD